MPTDAAIKAPSHPTATDRDATDDGLIQPLAPKADWRPWAGGLVSAALLISVVIQLARAPAEAVAEVSRFGPVFWLVFAALYLAQPLSELVIFGRLWRLPASGLTVLLRKGVINEIVFGYSGEVYLYLWARRKAGLTGAPFGAIKDVNILSALAGNVLTLAMLAISASAIHKVDLDRYLAPTIWCGLAVVALSLAILVFARRVFSLKRPELVFVARVHGVRLLATTVLTIALWAVALPGTPLSLWVVLVTVRLLVARLPFLTNKDLVFANLVFVIAGPHTPVGLLLGALAVITLAAHLVIIGVVSLLDLRRP
jgi:hypothetical protein